MIVAGQPAADLDDFVFRIPGEFDRVVHEIDDDLREAIFVHVDRGLVHVIVPRDMKLETGPFYLV